MWAASGNWKRQERDSLQSLQGECSPARALWTSDLQIYNKSVLFQATKYVAFATKVVGNSTSNLALGGSYFLEKIHRIRLNSPGKCVLSSERVILDQSVISLFFSNSFVAQCHLHTKRKGRRTIPSHTSARYQSE